MEYAEDGKSEIRKRFHVRRRRQRVLVFVLLAAGISAAFLGKGKTAVIGIPSSFFVPAFLFVVLGAILFSLYNWRCPACGQYLGKTMDPQFCSRCGAALQ